MIPARPVFITTATGRKFSPLKPRAADVFLYDIAHALSHQCRFSGHTREHYSVAEHSVRVSELLERWGESPEIQLWGLLHDASEAYLVDLPSPLKQGPFGEQYRNAERRVMEAICERWLLSPEEPEVVRRADLVMLATEIRDLMPPDMDPWSELPNDPDEQKIEPLACPRARAAFVNRFCDLAAAAFPPFRLAPWEKKR